MISKQIGRLFKRVGKKVRKRGKKEEKEEKRRGKSRKREKGGKTGVYIKFEVHIFAPPFLIYIFSPNEI